MITPPCFRKSKSLQLVGHVPAGSRNLGESLIKLKWAEKDLIGCGVGGKETRDEGEELFRS
jgi:hypothetical protein